MAAVAAVVARWQRQQRQGRQWTTIGGKVASNKSVNSRMMACNDKSGRWTTTQQPTK
jgi:hypothetical protein